MEEEGQQQLLVSFSEGEESTKMSPKIVVYASVTSMAIAGPLLAMMGFTLSATVILFLISSPLLLLFSPLLFFVGLLFAAALAGFAVSAALGVAGMFAFRWVYKSGRGNGGGFVGRMVEKVSEDGEKVKEEGKDWAGYLQDNARAVGSVANGEETRG
ncbi:Oleosin [Dillenia turbinata]|uniref:Oleosin n=1 Tax=Dillenia turbinata TaxID=194707 RepID=A0AAN8VMW6_9MAGN